MTGRGSVIGGVADFGTGLALAIYLALVLYQGNMKTLASDAVQDYGYLEWLVAVVILYAIYRVVDNKVIAWIIILAVIAVLLKVGVNTTLTSSIQKFGQGKQGLFATLIGSQSKQTGSTQTTLPATQTTPALTQA